MTQQDEKRIWDEIKFAVMTGSNKRAYYLLLNLRHYERAKFPFYVLVKRNRDVFHNVRLGA